MGSGPGWEAAGRGPWRAPKWKALESHLEDAPGAPTSHYAAVGGTEPQGELYSGALWGSRRLAIRASGTWQTPSQGPRCARRLWTQQGPWAWPRSGPSPPVLILPLPWGGASPGSMPRLSQAMSSECPQPTAHSEFRQTVGLVSGHWSLCRGAHGLVS